MLGYGWYSLSFNELQLVIVELSKCISLKNATLTENYRRRSQVAIKAVVDTPNIETFLQKDQTVISNWKFINFLIFHTVITHVFVLEIIILMLDLKLLIFTYILLC